MSSQYYVILNYNTWYYYRLSSDPKRDIKICANKDKTEAVKVKIWVPLQPLLLVDGLIEISRREFYKIVRLSNAKK